MHEEEEEKKVSTKRLLVEILASFGRHRERGGCSQNNPRDFFNQTTRFFEGDLFAHTHTKKSERRVRIATPHFA